MADPHTTERPPDTAASSQIGVDFQAMDISIPPEHVSSYHEPGRFWDFNDPPEVVAEELEEFDSDSDTLTDADPNSDAEGDNGNTANIADPKPKNFDSSEPEATPAQSDAPTVPPMPNASATRNSPSSLLNLLNSPHAPGRGSFDIECNLAAEEEEVKNLKAEKRRLEVLLKEAEQRFRKTHTRLEDSEKAFQVLQDQNGISEELWEEYEAFCESLEPEFGSRGGWSISCWTDHANSYVKYDPDLRLLSQFAEMPLQNCNFRCEAYTLVPKAKHRPDGNPLEKEYVVEFWPIASPELRTGTEKTWGDQYVSYFCYADSFVATYTDSKRSPTSTAWRLELSMTLHDLIHRRPRSCCGRSPTQRPHAPEVGYSSISARRSVPDILSSQGSGRIAVLTRLNLWAILPTSLKRILSRITMQLMTWKAIPKVHPQTRRRCLPGKRRIRTFWTFSRRATTSAWGKSIWAWLWTETT